MTLDRGTRLAADTMKVEIAVLSKAGGRSLNEDACGYWVSEGPCCWVLSDGAGGHGGGDVASQSVVNCILRDFSASPIVAPESIAVLIRRSNDALLRAQKTDEKLRDMRATVAVLALDRGRRVGCWGHLGDSRIYGFRSGHIRFQSRDHSVLQSMLDAGLGNAAMLRNHPQRSVLLAALGSADAQIPEMSPDVEQVVDGDVYLLCSDGLWEYVEEAVMERLLAVSLSAERWLAALEAEVLARARGGHDNYSAIAVWVGDRVDATRIIVKS